MVLKLNGHSLLWIQIYLLLCVRFISNFFSNNYIVYICDIVTVSVFLVQLRISKGKTTKIGILFLLEALFWFISFVMSDYGEIGAFINLFRVFIRFYVVFCAVQQVFDLEDYRKLIGFFDFITIVHVAMVIFQIFVIKPGNGDAVGGIFGIVYGYGNSASHTLILLVTLLAVYRYFSYQDSLIRTVIRFACVFSVAMLTEIKAFIFEAALILIIYLILNKKIQLRTGILFILIPIAGLFFVNYIALNFNFNIFDLATVDTYLKSGYAYSSEGIGRLDGYEKIFRNCFDSNIKTAVTGLGFATSISSFTENNFPGMNVGYFTYAKIFYDVGIWGTIMYFLPFILSIVKGMKIVKKDVNLGALCITIGTMALYLNFYGNHMESDFCGYFFYVFLALPYIVERKIKNNDLEILSI